MNNCTKERVVCHCEMKENAEIIAKILDYDVDEKIADVVEVVRCRECKNFEFKDIISFTNDSVGHCKYQPVCTVMLGSDFCSYGERRETNG